MILIYTHKITPRFTYIMKHIFTRMLMMEVGFTNSIEEFVAFNGPKFSYTRQHLGNEFFVRSYDLLFEQGISDLDIAVHDWDDVPCFFHIRDRSDIPFDIFAASFYLITRYEEYLPHVKDEHGRYPATDSLAYRNRFLEIPVIDVWVLKFRDILQERFPDLQSGERTFVNQPVIDVSEAFHYKKKGILRTIGSTLLDIYSLNLSGLVKRFKVLLGLERDPYDNFRELIRLHKRLTPRPIYFFLLGDYSNYDKNISINEPSFRSLIKSVADYSIVSLMSSYESFNDVAAVKMERRRLIELINRPVKRVKSRFNRMNIPLSYRTIFEAEFNEDYSMGYTNHVGFKAGTCTPFYFYDINFEEQLYLKVNPFCIQYTALDKIPDRRNAWTKAMEIKEQVKKVNGTFIPVFSNRYLTFKGKNDFWTSLYKELINEQ